MRLNAEDPFPVAVYNGSVWSMGAAHYVSPTGSASIQALASNVLIHFGGCKFSTLST